MSKKLNVLMALLTIACIPQSAFGQTKQCKNGSCKIVRKSPSCKTGNCSGKSSKKRVLKKQASKAGSAVACEKRECKGKCASFKKAPKAVGKAIALPFKATGKLLKKVFGKKR